MDTKVSKILETREYLKQASIMVRPLIEKGVYPNVNEAIMASYTDEANIIFKPMPIWNKEGYQIKKGSKAFAIWGRPRKNTGIALEQSPTIEEGQYSFYPVCYIFSNDQVFRKETANA